MLKKILSVGLIFNFILINVVISYASSVPITKQNLTSALQKFTKSDINNKNCDITIKDNNILINSDDGNFTIDYNLKNKPTFLYTLDIQKGMGYETFNKKIKDLFAPMLICYLAIANINDIEFKNAYSYFLLSSLPSSLEISVNLNDAPYIIVPDNVTVTSKSNSKVIKESEFGNHVVDYTKTLYGKKEILDDSKYIGSFKCIKELKDDTAYSCKLVITMEINLDADFSKLKEFKNPFDNFSK